MSPVWKIRRCVAAPAALVALLGLAACSAPADGPAAASATDGPAAAQADDAPLDWCRRMPLADVAAILRRTAGVTVSEMKAGVGGMCSYRYYDPGQRRMVRLLIDITRMPSAEQARLAMASHRQDFASAGRPTADVDGLGDAAFSIATEAMGVVVRRGRYYGQINLGVDDLPVAGLRPAVLALAREALHRLPR